MKGIMVFLFAVFFVSTFGAYGYQDISSLEVFQKLEKGDEMVIVDVRELWEYNSGHIPSAINMPWNSGVLEERYAELPTGTDIIVVCRSGNRSVSASLFLDGREFEGVFNMLGGMLDWEWEVVVPGQGAHHHGPGWIRRNSSDTTFIHCPTDLMDWVAFPPGGMMHHQFPDSVYCNFVEVHPDTMPWPHDSTMIGGYFIDISDPMGHGMMGGGHMGFQHGIGLHLHYDDEILIGMVEDEMMLRYWEEAGNQWIDVHGAMYDGEQTTILVSQNPLRSYYGLFTSSIEVLMGDANGDGERDVTDAVLIVQFILGIHVPTQDQIRVTDVNDDGLLNVLDVLALVNIILGIDPQKVDAGDFSQAFLKVQPNVVTKGKVVTGQILLESEVPVSGLQFTLTYDGRKVHPGKPVTSANIDHMNLNWNVRDDEVQIVLYSIRGEQIPAEPGSIVEIPFEQLEGTSGECELHIEEAVLVGCNGETINVSNSTSVLTLDAAPPQSFGLFQNYPNPFNPETVIAFQLPGNGGGTEQYVTLKIFNILGQEIRTLIDGQKRAGYYSVLWDGRDNGGQEVVSGFYIYRLSANDFTATRSMVLMK